MNGTAGTVLAADDDSDLRSLYQCWLSSSYDVQTAADGVGALQQLDETVDVVLLDREMPNKDGVAVARELERLEIDPAVVMISGVEPGPELLDIPVDDYLQKPVEGDTVIDRVGRVRTVARQPRPRRYLLALDTRRQIVETAAAGRALDGEPAYRRAVETLDSHSDTLETARRAVSGERDGGEDPEAIPPVRESP